MDLKSTASHSSQRFRRWLRAILRAEAGIAGFLKSRCRSPITDRAGEVEGFVVRSVSVLFGVGAVSRSSLSDALLLWAGILPDSRSVLAGLTDFSIVEAGFLLKTSVRGGTSGEEGGGSSSSLLSPCDTIIFFTALFCFFACSFALALKCPSDDGFAFATTGLGVATFLCSSILALRVSYSARCRCCVNNFAVWSNSSSTIIHSSSRRSNLSMPVSMYLEPVRR